MLFYVVVITERRKQNYRFYLIKSRTYHFFAKV